LIPEIDDNSLSLFNFQLHWSPNLNAGFYISEAYPEGNWNNNDSILRVSTVPGGISGALKFNSRFHSFGTPTVILLMGLDINLSPWCGVFLSTLKTLVQAFIDYDWSDNLPLLNAFNFEFNLGSQYYMSSVIIERHSSEPTWFNVHFKIEMVEAFVIE
jgi:hypothetical protein